MSAPAVGIVEPVDWRNGPPAEPHALTVATMRAQIPNRGLDVAGRAYWLPAADGMVCWAVQFTAQDGAGSATGYGAAGPARSWAEALELGQAGLRQALAAMQPEVRASGARGAG